MLLYESIAENILEMINNEKLPHGYQLETLEELAEHYQTSKNTIVRALENLEARGFIYQVRGSGSFVRRKKRNYHLNLLSNQGYRNSLRKFSSTSKFVKKEIMMAPEYVRRELDVESDEKIIYIERIRYIGNQSRTLSLEKSYYRQKIIKDIPVEAIESSIFAYIQDELGVEIGFSDVYLKADKLSKYDANLLELDVGDPVLIVEEVYHTKTGEPFDYTELVYNYQESFLYAQSSTYQD